MNIFNFLPDDFQILVTVNLIAKAYAKHGLNVSLTPCGFEKQFRKCIMVSNCRHNPKKMNISLWYNLGEFTLAVTEQYDRRTILNLTKIMEVV
jgi:hypothetical protein